MDEKANLDHRHHARVDYEASVDFESEDRFFTGFVRNVSNGGLFIAAGSCPAVGSKVVVSFRIPTLPEPIVAEALVRWVRPFRPDTPDMTPGMGVEFQALPPEAVTAIDAFISKHDTLFYE